MIGSSVLSDQYGRVMRDLRISVTDRCNFRCVYCLPETEEAASFYRLKAGAAAASAPALVRPREWKPRQEILTFEEIERLVRIGAALGLRKVRLTGGEPLLRNGIEDLVSRLAAISPLEDLALTTNGFFFPAKGARLAKAGLKRVTISLDSLDRANFRKMAGRDGLNEVLEAIDLARELRLEPVKLNAVIIRGLNDHEIENLVQFALEKEVSLRFIEFMPLDSGRAWQKELVVSASEIMQIIRARFPIEPVASSNPSETARRWKITGTAVEIGLIAPVTEPFCGHCNRIRLTADGKIRTCLFSLTEPDLKPLLRGGATDFEISNFLRAVVWQKEEKHHIGASDFIQPPRTMSCIGG